MLCNWRESNDALCWVGNVLGLYQFVKFVFYILCMSGIFLVIWSSFLIEGHIYCGCCCLCMMYVRHVFSMDVVNLDVRFMLVMSFVCALKQV